MGHFVVWAKIDNDIHFYSSPGLRDFHAIKFFYSYQEKLQLVSVLGAGLLVGTALSVIIPEGVNSLCQAPHTSSLASGKCLYLHKG